MVVVKPMDSIRLPQLTGDIILEVFTHKSVRPVSAVSETDNDRLATLGQSVLEMITTLVLFMQRPFQSAEDIDIRRGQILCDRNIRQWVQDNGLLDKLRFARRLVKIDGEEDLRVLFYSYIGALYIQNRMPDIQTWLSYVIDPDNGPPPPSPASYTTELPAYPFEDEEDAPTFVIEPQPVLPSPISPPPSPTTAGPSVPIHPGLNTVTVALVNQIVSQRAYQIQYVAASVGPSHAPTWTVRCIINGVERGLGVGSTKKVAELEAARKAYVAMEWGSWYVIGFP